MALSHFFNKHTPTYWTPPCMICGNVPAYHRKFENETWIASQSGFTPREQAKCLCDKHYKIELRKIKLIKLANNEITEDKTI